MCFISNFDSSKNGLRLNEILKNTSKTAEKDIKVYKILGSFTHKQSFFKRLFSKVYYYSIFQDFRYDLNVLYSISFLEIWSDATCFYNKLSNSYKFQINKGLHSCSDLKQILMLYGYYDEPYYYEKHLFEGIIPKGASYWENESGEIVSTFLKITKNLGKVENFIKKLEKDEL